MKSMIKSLSVVAAFAAASFTSHAASTAALSDLIVGFQQGGASTDLVIDFGSVSSYLAPGTYTLGNYASQLSAFNGAGAITFGAISTARTGTSSLNYKYQDYTTSGWTTGTAGTLGVANSVQYSGIGNAALGTGYSRDANIVNTINNAGGYTLGTAMAIDSASAVGWTKQLSFNFTSTMFQKSSADLATGSTFAASDLYLVTNPVSGTAGQTSTFVGTLAVFQNGDVTFTVIPEPSTYALILGAMTVGFVSLRRRFSKAV